MSTSTLTSSHQSAIKTLAATFERAFDDGDIDLHMQTRAGENDLRSPFDNYATHADYREWVTGFYQQIQAQGHTRHLIWNNEVDVSASMARINCYLTINTSEGPDGRSHRAA